MKPKIKKLWIDALRSGEYKQGYDKLCSAKDNTFCCLGVLCEVFQKEARKNKKKLLKEKIMYIEKQKQYDDKSGSLPPRVCEWSGLTPNPIMYGTTISSINDSKKYNFKQIAAAIEKYL